MATRLNQEAFEVLTPSLAAGGGNVRLNQLAFLMLVSGTLEGSRVQLIGGPFQDALGNPLSNGYLLMQLQHDAVALNTGQIIGALAVRIPLDINGYVQGTDTGAPIYIWPNDLLSPAGGDYLIWAYDASNRLVWDNPQVQQVLSTTNPFNINAWIPGP